MYSINITNYNKQVKSLIFILSAKVDIYKIPKQLITGQVIITPKDDNNNAQDCLYIFPDICFKWYIVKASDKPITNTKPINTGTDSVNANKTKANAARILNSHFNFMYALS